MNHHSKVLGLTMGVIFFGCGGTPPGTEEIGLRAQPIYGGTVDNGDPAVVALTDDWGYYFCSGTIVGATHVVTAAHCVQDSTPAYVFTCTDSNSTDPYWSPECYLAVSSSEYHPGYAGESAHDIAVVFLQDPTNIAPKAIPAESLDASAVGTGVRLVGFGDDENGGSGVKQQAVATIDEVYPDTFLMWGVPNHCYGDSGGPGFWPAGDPEEMLVGVTSAGVTDDCAGGGIDTMVGDNLDWLASMGVDVPDPPAPPAPTGSGGSGSGGAGSTSATTGAGVGGADPTTTGAGASTFDDDDATFDDEPNEPLAAEAKPESTEGGCAVGSRGAGGASATWLLLALAALSRRRSR